MKIVWFSRHNPTPRQLSSLRELFGEDVQVIRDTKAFDGADDVAARFAASGADEMVIVAPDAVIRQLIKRGIFPLKAEMRVCPADHSKREVSTHPRKGGTPRHYRFVRFKRIRRFEIVLETVEPRKPQAGTSSDQAPAA